MDDLTDDLINAERRLEGKPEIERPRPPGVEPPQPVIGEVTDEGTGLDIPTISVPGAAQNPYGNVESVAGDISVLPAQPNPAQQLFTALTHQLVFVPKPLIYALVIGILGIGVLGMNIAGVFESCGASELVSCPSQTPAPTASPLRASQAAATQQAAATAFTLVAPTRAPAHVIASNVTSQPLANTDSCQLVWSWTLSDVQPSYGIRIHFTGTNSRPPSSEDVQAGAMIATNYKDGVFTWFGFGQKGGGEYTAEVVLLGPAKPDGPTLLRTTC